VFTNLPDCPDCPETVDCPTSRTTAPVITIVVDDDCPDYIEPWTAETAMW
jgi:hypothetical protein